MEKKTILMLAIIGLLVITAGIQTIQLVKLSGLPVVVQGAAASSVPLQSSGSGGSQGSSASASLNDLPSMVGGC